MWWVVQEILKKREEEENDIAEAEREAARVPLGSKPPVPSHLTVSVYDTARSKLATQVEAHDNAASQVLQIRLWMLTRSCALPAKATNLLFVRPSVACRFLTTT